MGAVRARTLYFDEEIQLVRVVLPLCWLGSSALSWVGAVDELVPFILTFMMPPLMWHTLWDALRCFVGKWRKIMTASGIAFLFNFLLIGQLYHLTIVPLAGRAWNADSISARQEQLAVDVSDSLILAIAACFLGPVVEELVFRYGLLRPLLSVHVIVGHVVSGLMFALLHMASELFAGDYWQIVPGIGYFVSGLCYGICYTRAGNLGAPILAHVMNNVISVILIVLGAP